MTSEEVLARARPNPSGITLAFGAMGILALVFQWWVIAIALMGLAYYSWTKGEVVLTARYVRVKRDLASGSTELLLSKVESIQVGTAIGKTKPVAVVGTGGKVYELGSLPDAQAFRDKLSDALEASRVK